MIRAAVRNALTALAVLAVLAGHAAAQTAVPALRAEVTVDSDLVRIGDLVENAGPVANIPIFRAPDPGTTGAVATDRVVAAIRPHQLIDIDTRGLAAVIVTRASRSIGPQEISARIAKALAGQYALGEARHIMLSFDRPPHTLAVEPSANGELQVTALNYDRRTGRFDVTLDLPSSIELHRQPPRFTGTAIATVDAVAVDRPLDRGEVLQASDLTVLQRPKGVSGIITDARAAVGLAARRELRPGQPLNAADLMKPEIVQRNETVTLVYEVPGVTLTLRGEAQQVGALGETIGVLNRQTKRVVLGVVTGPGRISVSPIGATRLAETTPPARISAAEPPPRK